MKSNKIRFFLTATTATVIAMSTVTAASASDINKATFDTSAPGSSAPQGVSPEVVYDSATKTYYLLTTANPPTQYRSSDGINWSPVGNTLPNGFDWSIVQEGPSNYRLYFAEIKATSPGGPPKPCEPNTKQLRYATSSDLINWQVVPGAIFADVGCGVPHVMKTSDGRYFLYFNKRDTQHGVRVATSSDGLNWSERPGIIANEQDLVDPAPIQLADGSFIMIASTTGGPQSGGLQELQILSSKDGITWSLRPKKLYSPAGASALDPSVKLLDGVMRVWYSYAPGGNHDNGRITVGTVKFDGASAATSSGNKSPSAGAATKVKPKVGKACTKRGAKSGALVCTSSNGKLVWK